MLMLVLVLVLVIVIEHFPKRRQSDHEQEHEHDYDVIAPPPATTSCRRSCDFKHRATERAIHQEIATAVTRTAVAINH